MMPLSQRDIVRELGAELGRGIDTLMTASRVSHRFSREGGALTAATGQPFRWDPLPTEKLPLQKRLMARYREYESLVTTLSRSFPQSRHEERRQLLERIRVVIDQESPTTRQTVEENFDRAKQALELINRRLEMFLATEDDVTRLVLDTSALYANPGLEEWEFDQIPRFWLVLVPAVIAELDQHKALVVVRPITTC